MGIKAIDTMPKPERNERMESLKRDVREIIDNRIGMCEITDPPYPQSTMRERLGKAIRIVVWEQAKKEKTIHAPSASRVFKIESRKKDGTVHWYVTFDVDLWDEEWKKIKEQ